MDLTADQRFQMTALRERLGALAGVALPGKGATIDRWRLLWHAAGDDLAHARLVEGHLDALAILHELGRSDLVEPERAWGVWAAQPDRLRAERGSGGWRLRGSKAWCSGSTGLDAALVTATADDGPRLFAVDPGRLEFDQHSWAPIGMAATASHTASFDLVIAADREVGGTDAYVDRPGFWHGGAGVTACWYGGAEALLVPLVERLRNDWGSDRAAVALGPVRAHLDAARALLEQLAREFDDHPTDRLRAQRGALTSRLVVEEVARRTIDAVGVALGAGVLCADTPHARRVADLIVYLRQLDVWQAAADLARLDAATKPGVA